MKKILFSDLDGTLLRGLWVKNKDRLSIRKEMTDNFLFIISTGRNFKSFTRFIFIQKVKYNYAILGNGSLIIDSKNRIIHEAVFEVDRLMDVLHFVVKMLGLHTKMDISITYGYKTKVFKNYKIINDCNILQEFPEKISSCCISIKNKKIQQEFIELLKSKMNFVNIDVNGIYIDITKVNVNKQYGVSKILEYLDADSVKTYAIGDSYNDISMLKSVDYSFAVKNAKQDVKNIADKTVKDIADCIKVIQSPNNGK